MSGLSLHISWLCHFACFYILLPRSLLEIKITTEDLITSVHRSSQTPLKVPRGHTCQAECAGSSLPLSLSLQRGTADPRGWLCGTSSRLRMLCGGCGTPSGLGRVGCKHLLGQVPAGWCLPGLLSLACGSWDPQNQPSREAEGALLPL